MSKSTACLLTAVLVSGRWTTLLVRGWITQGFHTLLASVPDSNGDTVMFSLVLSCLCSCPFPAPQLHRTPWPSQPLLNAPSCRFLAIWGPSNFRPSVPCPLPPELLVMPPQRLQPHLSLGGPSRLSFLSSCHLVPAPLSTPLSESTVGAPRAGDEATWALRRSLRKLWVPEMQCQSRYQALLHT